jgi:CHAT domain-containing protein/tetratricopeptide (TPR) repeat protein
VTVLSSARIPTTAPGAVLLTAIAVSVWFHGYLLDAAAGQAINECCTYDRQEREARSAAADAVSRFGRQTLQAASANDALVEALLLNGRGASPETVALARQTVEAKQAIVGDSSLALVPSLLNLGDGLTAAGDYEHAIAVLQKAVSIAERDLPNAPAVPDALDRLGSTLTAAERLDEALPILERSLQMKESRGRGDDPAIADTLERLALVRQRKGDYEKSGADVRRAVVIKRAVHSADPEYVTTLNLLAQQLWFESRLRESANTSERAVALADRTLRPDHPTVARSLRYLAGTLEDLGELERAHALRQRALAIAESTFGPNHYETAIYLNSAAAADAAVGDYASARKLFERATRNFESKFGPWHDYVATARFNAALVDARLGDYSAAQREQARATAIWERTRGVNHPYVALALTELAVVLREQGSAAQALPLLQRALTIQQRALGMGHRDVAATLTNLSAAEFRLGNVTAAQRYAARARQIWQQQDEPDAPAAATTLSLQAQIQLQQGAVAEAQKSYEESLAIRARSVGTQSPTYAEAQAGLAITLAAAGLIPSALENAVSAENVSREHLRLLLAHLPERLSLNYASNRPKGLDLILSLALSSSDAATAAADEAIRSRALVLDEMAARRDGRLQSAALSDLLTAFSTARQRLANLVVRGPGSMKVSRYSALLDEARAESERAELALAEQSTEFRSGLTRARFGLADVRDAIPADGALVSFLRYTRFVFHGAAASSSATHAVPAIDEVPSYIAIVLRPGRPPAPIALGRVTSIDALVNRWRQGIAAANQPSATGSPGGSSRDSGARLRRAIWDLLAPHLEGVARVFLVPDGSLALVPFAALPVGQRSYLVESGPLIHYLSAERDLVGSQSARSAGRGLLAIGAPAFGPVATAAARTAGSPSTATIQRSAGACDGLEGVMFSPLPGTRREIQELATLWNQRIGASDAGASARLLVGAEATEATFKRDAHQFRILHIASHGFFVGGNCGTAAPGTRGVGGLLPRRQDTTDNPLLLSGVALAGANRRAHSGAREDDGVLTADEVASLDLSGVEWAVLSACDTGIGELRPGEGVLGLRRAFQIAGARTVVMSLWSVEDRATRDWMRALYAGRLQQQLSSAEAVRSATVNVLKDRRSRGLSTEPFYWAAFVAAGDWR